MPYVCSHTDGTLLGNHNYYSIYKWAYYNGIPHINVIRILEEFTFGQTIKAIEESGFFLIIPISEFSTRLLNFSNRPFGS